VLKHLFIYNKRGLRNFFACKIIRRQEAVKEKYLPSFHSSDVGVLFCSAKVRKKLPSTRFGFTFKKLVKTTDLFVTNNFGQLEKIIINPLKRRLVAA
jgi:hypothetical protein